MISLNNAPEVAKMEIIYDYAFSSPQAFGSSTMKVVESLGRTCIYNEITKCENIAWSPFLTKLPSKCSGLVRIRPWDSCCAPNFR